MRQRQRGSEEKVVYLSCPCAERLRELKKVLEQAGFTAFYALEAPPEGATVVHLHCPLSFQDRQILQAILTTGSIKEAAAQLGLSTNTVHKHLRFMALEFGVHSTLQLIAIALQKGFIRWESTPSPERLPLGREGTSERQKTNLKK